MTIVCYEARNHVEIQTELVEMNPVLKGYLKLMRPANLPTATADILAGVAIAGITVTTNYLTVDGIRLYPKILYLIMASNLLYAAGVVLNDVFDRKVDILERPERPIPSGLIPVEHAAIFGAILMLGGVLFAFLVTPLSGKISVLLAIAILSYDAIAKKHSFFGPLNMGLCRAINLVLGMSFAGSVIHPEYGLIHMVYIFAITLISRGEVHANNKNHIIWAGILYAGVIFAVVKLISEQPGGMLSVIPFLLLFIYLIFKPLIRAYRVNNAENIKKAVMAGVLSVIALDAMLATGFSTWWYGLMVIMLLPLSIMLARMFSVT